MHSTSYTLLGVMSGTSLDGIDLAYAEFWKEASAWRYKLGPSKTIPYQASWITRLEKAVLLSPEDLQQLDVDYTAFLGQTIKAFIDTHPVSHLDGVASHGHTVLHRPEEGITHQIGNLPQLSSYVGKRVICDFRVQDVALGGQGAPLVPIGDALLFSEYAACLNIGGFANLSFQKGLERVAYDICPANIVLNAWARRLGKAYDAAGEIARQGTVDFKLLDLLNALDYYQEGYPKSLGLEWVQRHVFPLLERSKISDQDVLATFTLHMAVQIAHSLQSSIQGSKNTVLVTGGGTYNKYLVEQIADSSNLKIVIPDEKTIEFKEALIFALMGVLRMRNTINVLNCVTGASVDHCAGQVYSP